VPLLEETFLCENSSRVINLAVVHGWLNFRETENTFTFSPSTMLMCEEDIDRWTFFNFLFRSSPHCGPVRRGVRGGKFVENCYNLMSINIISERFEWKEDGRADVSIYSTHFHRT
jgi:hypothetical protein